MYINFKLQAIIVVKECNPLFSNMKKNRYHPKPKHTTNQKNATHIQETNLVKGTKKRKVEEKGQLRKDKLKKRKKKRKNIKDNKKKSK